jgi:hypothetical protein
LRKLTNRFLEFASAIVPANPMNPPRVYPPDMATSRARFAVVASVAAVVSLAVVPVIAATMPAVKMTVVDGRDGTPIAGLVAVFWLPAREGTFTGHGGKHAILFAVEAVSDQSGELRFPKQDFKTQPFFLNTTLENPSMLLLKPGYAPLNLYNQISFPTVAEASRWDYDGRTVKMQPARSDDTGDQAYWIAGVTGAILGFEGGCGWKRMPRVLVTADRMFGGPGKQSTLRDLFRLDDMFVERGCGSPKAFFEPYLRQ